LNLDQDRRTTVEERPFRAASGSEHRGPSGPVIAFRNATTSFPQRTSDSL
jgi:hypothetical protein